MRLSRRPDPFDHPDWIFELKYDGFRAVAYVEEGRCRLLSRNGNAFKSFSALTDDLAEGLLKQTAILDGEIVCVDSQGRCQFRELLFRRGKPVFYAFDLLHYRGRDLRTLPLHERKAELSGLVRRSACERLFYADHVEQNGTALFRRVCELDLEGIVAKHKYSPYISDGSETSWIKLRNRNYSQLPGRDELFDRMAGREPGPAETDGWTGCVLACAEQEL